LTKRAQIVLIELVRLFIRRGEPVSSKLIADKLSIAISSATIRNIMADLEAESYLHQPHTSAGRIPTDKGYRFYVDYLNNLRLNERDKEVVKSIAHMDGSLDDMLGETARLLSQSTHNVALIMVPNYARMTMQHIDFVALSRQKIMVIMVASTGCVLKKIIEISENISQDELISIANFLKAHFRGLTLVEIREHIVMMMRQDAYTYDLLMKKALTLATQSFEMDINEPTIYVEGASHILETSSNDNVGNALNVLRALEEKNTILLLLTKTLEKEGLHVLIGAENVIQDFSEISFISSTYKIAETVFGCIGILGPRRMPYERIIPLIDSISETVNKKLNSA
jgi:heat-inducible transcriptional repressor